MKKVTSSFLHHAASVYESCPEFSDCLIVDMIKASTKRKMGNGDKAFDDKVIIFYHFIQKFSPQAAEVVSANLICPGQLWMWRLNDSEVQDRIFDVTHEVLVARMNKADADSAQFLSIHRCNKGGKSS